MTEPTLPRRWICTACEARIVLEEACLSGKLPDEATVCDLCGTVGSFKFVLSVIYDN